MKTEISIPDPIFAATQEMATKLGVSLSDLYTRAVSDWLARHQDRERKLVMECEWQHLSGEEITARLNAIYEREPSHLDPFIAQLQARTFEKEER